MMSASPPLALVTGGTGLLGANLVAELVASGYRVRVLTREPSRVEELATRSRRFGGWRPHEVVCGDIREETVRTQSVRGIDFLFHACHSHEYWKPNTSVYEVNVTATLALLEDVRRERPGCTVIFSSSRSTLRDPGIAFEPANLDQVPRRQFNSLTKLWAERAVERRALEAGLDVRYVHSPYLIGPLDLSPTPLRLVIPAALLLPIPVAPTGGCSVASAASVAHVHRSLAEGGKSGEHVVVKGTGVRYADYFEFANDAAGHAVRPVTIRSELLQHFASGEIFDPWCAARMSEVTYCASEAGEGRTEELREAVLATAAWFRQHPLFPGLGSLIRYASQFV